MQAYKKAIEIKPDYASAYNNLGNAFRRVKIDEAINLQKSQLIKSDYANAYNNMGNVLKQDKLNQAIEAYRKALSIKQIMRSL